jgi:hypothetical protein
MAKESDHSGTFIGLAIVCSGLLLIVVGGQGEIRWGVFNVSDTLVAVGSTLLFVGGVHWLHEFYTKRKLFSEVVELIVGSKSVAECGVSEFYQNSHDIRFREIISESNTLTTIFSYNSRFLEDYDTEITSLLQRGGKAEFIFLARNSSTISLLKELGWDKSSMDAHYGKIDRFQTRPVRFQSQFRILYINIIPRYTVVKLEHSLYFIWNTASHERQKVPAVRVKSRTPLWDFISADIEAVKRESGFD